MKILFSFILLLSFSFNVFSAPSNTMSITPVAVGGEIIEADDENSRNNAVSTTYNVHSHIDITQTTSNDFQIGDGQTGDKSITIDNGDVNLPSLQFDDTSNVWEASNDGVTHFEIILGGTDQTIAGDKTFSGNTTLTTADINGGTLDNVAIGVSTPAVGNFTTVITTDDVTVTGTTPSITIGDAGEEDTQITFDGNAQDFHIGLQDSTDDLTIGLGTTLGTTTHMNFTEDGEITKPLQPSFLAEPAVDQNNIAINTAVDVVLGTVRTNQGSNFSTPTFTAPVTGNYLFGISIALNQIDTGATGIDITLLTSNKSYIHRFDPRTLAIDGIVSFPISVIADMDANDTAKITVIISAGATQTDIVTLSWFSGALIN